MSYRFPAVLGSGSVLLLAACRAPAPVASEPASYVGRAQCAACHQVQDSLWRGSDHDRAMQLASAETVLGDFDSATFERAGVTSTFSRQGGRYLVRTDGPHGALQDFEVAYTFGVRPLQQYLIAFPDGRFQALGIAWDTRPAGQGGQRWFHLYPNERLTAGEPLHWTGADQTWNYMCAECHSTNLRKGYDPTADRYATTWSELNVSCEACHGPGSRHAVWARAARGAAGDTAPVAVAYPVDRGLVVVLRDRGTWALDSGSAVARRTSTRGSDVEIETCARCHSRRGQIWNEYQHGRPLTDTHRPALLDDGLYFADGQIREEVYEYGSFLQSAMYRAGVTCSDCHDAHALAVRDAGNELCARCHLASTYDARSHHFHRPGTEAASCVACHMPSRTYMVVDPRRDHSLRVPRPDLSAALGTPNPCTGCHRDRSAAWAARATGRWYRPGRSGTAHFGSVLQAGRQGAPGAGAALAQLAADSAAPGIVRATALSLLAHNRLRVLEAVLEPVVVDPDPLVRLAAVEAAEALEPGPRLRLVAPVLRDSLRAVRLAATMVAAQVPAALMTPDQRVALDTAVAEYRASQRMAAERAEAHLNLGLLHSYLGELDDAEREYREAAQRDPRTAVNLADLYRMRERETDAERVLREALARAPDDADLHHALGLVLVRRRRRVEAAEELGRAVLLAPTRARHAFAYGLALRELGRTDSALAILAAAQRRYPYDRDLLTALATISAAARRQHAALEYARQLLALDPDDRGAQGLVERLSRVR